MTRTGRGAAGGPLRSEDLPGRLHSVEFGHPDIHEHDVRLQRIDKRHGFAAVAGFAHDVDPRVGANDDRDPCPEEFLVVDEQHADRRGRIGGIRDVWGLRVQLVHVVHLIRLVHPGHLCAHPRDLDRHRRTRSHRERRGRDEPTVVQAGVQAAAHRGQPTHHPVDPQAGPLGRGGIGSNRIAHLQSQLTRAVAGVCAPDLLDVDRLTAIAVSHRVGEHLLGDPVGDRLEFRR
jgi:hypothetical protein